MFFKLRFSAALLNSLADFAYLFRMSDSTICGITSGAFSGSRIKFLEQFGRGEETLLSSGWTLIRSELSPPNFNSTARAEVSLSQHSNQAFWR